MYFNSVTLHKEIACVKHPFCLLGTFIRGACGCEPGHNGGPVPGAAVVRLSRRYVRVIGGSGGGAGEA